MRRNIWTAAPVWAAAMALALMLGAVSCGEGPRVVQGTVASYDEQTKALVVAEESTPDSLLTIDLTEADMGRAPEVGDKVRVAYHERSGTLRGVRVMDLSHQIH